MCASGDVRIHKRKVRILNKSQVLFNVIYSICPDGLKQKDTVHLYDTPANLSGDPRPPPFQCWKQHKFQMPMLKTTMSNKSQVLFSVIYWLGPDGLKQKDPVHLYHTPADLSGDPHPPGFNVENNINFRCQCWKRQCHAFFQLICIVSFLDFFTLTVNMSRHRLWNGDLEVHNW